MPLIDFDVQCVRCGTNLRSLDSQGACRGCRLPVAETLSLAGVDSVELRISGDLVCTHCGYNLRTLHANSVCTECGKPIAPSLSPDPLRRASRDWLRGMRRGLGLLVGVALVSLVLDGIGCLSYPLMLISSKLAGWPQYFGQQLCCVLWCVAVWQATRPEPGCQAWAGTGGWRAWARGMGVARLAGDAASYSVIVISRWANTGRLDFLPIVGLSMTLGQIVLWGVVLVSVVLISAASSVLLFAHLRQVMLHAGRKARLATAMIWLLILEGVLDTVQYGPVRFVMVCQQYNIWPALDILRWEVRTIWHAGYVFQKFCEVILGVLGVVAFLRFKGIMKDAAEGRFASGTGVAAGRMDPSRT